MAARRALHLQRRLFGPRHGAAATGGWSARPSRPRGRAVQWREDARVDLRRGVLVAPKPTTLRELGELWLESARGGGIRNRSGDRYKPSTLRGYEQALRQYVYPALGSAKLQNIRPGDVQRLADTLVGRGLNPSTVRNALLPLRAICRRSLRQGDLTVNPHDRTRGSRCPKRSQPRRCTRGGANPDSSSTRRGPSPMGDGLLRGPSARRTSGASLVRRRPSRTE